MRAERPAEGAGHAEAGAESPRRVWWPLKLKGRLDCKDAAQEERNPIEESDSFQKVSHSQTLAR